MQKVDFPIGCFQSPPTLGINRGDLYYNKIPIMQLQLNARNKLFNFVASALCLVAGVPCEASTTLDFDFTNPSLDYSSSDWDLIGNAFWANDPDPAGVLNPNTRLRLTSASVSQSGAAWYTVSTFDLGSGNWAFGIVGQLSYPQNDGADGMAMHLTTGDVPSFVPGIDGQGLSIPTISLALDTYQNAGDPSSYHMTLWLSGTKLGEVNLPSESDNPFELMLSYDLASNVLTAEYFNVPGELEADQTITATNALTGEQLDSLAAARWGFSAATGAAGENHDVLSASVNVVPEPSAAALSILSLALLAFRRNHRGHR